MKDFFCMCLHLGFGNDLFQNAALIDDECGSMGAIVFSSHELFQSPNTVGIVDTEVFIAKKIKLQIKFFNEFLLKLYEIQWKFY